MILSTSDQVQAVISKKHCENNITKFQLPDLPVLASYNFIRVKLTSLRSKRL